MSARQLAIGMALQRLEPEIMNLDRMARLVSAYAGDVVEGPEGASLSEIEADVLLFGIYETQRRATELSARFRKAFRPDPDA